MTKFIGKKSMAININGIISLPLIHKKIGN